MKGTETIKNLGTIELNGVSVGDGRLEVHIPIKDMDNQLDATIDKCYEDFYQKHPEVKQENTFYNLQVIFSCGGFRGSVKNEAEFLLMVIVWSDVDNVDEFYEEIPMELNEEDSKKLRKIVWDGLGEMLFGI